MTERRGREFFRINDFLPIRFEIIPQDKIDYFRNLIQQKPSPKDAFHEVSPGPLPFDPADFRDPNLRYVAEILNSINQKLDVLLDRERVVKARSDFPDPVNVDLSASSMRFSCKESFVPGTFLHLSFILNDCPPKRIDTLAEVIRVETNDRQDVWGDAPFRVAVKFAEMNAATTECLVRYVFMVQRDRLHQGRSGDTDSTSDSMG